MPEKPGSHRLVSSVEKALPFPLNGLKLFLNSRWGESVRSLAQEASGQCSFWGEIQTHPLPEPEFCALRCGGEGAGETGWRVPKFPSLEGSFPVRNRQDPRSPARGSDSVSPTENGTRKAATHLRSEVQEQSDTADHLAQPQP